MTNATDARRAALLLRYSEFVVQTEAQFLEVAAAIRASDAEAGMVLVPRVPTQKMYDDAGAIIEREYGESDWETSKDMAEGLSPTPIWNAMIAAHEGDG